MGIEPLTETVPAELQVPAVGTRGTGVRVSPRNSPNSQNLSSGGRQKTVLHESMGPAGDGVGDGVGDGSGGLFLGRVLDPRRAFFSRK